MLEKLKFSCYMNNKDKKKAVVNFRIKLSSLNPYPSDIYNNAWDLAHYIEDDYESKIIDDSLEELNEKIEQYNFENYYNKDTYEFINLGRNGEYGRMYDIFKITKPLMNNIIKLFIEKQERFDKEKGMYKPKDLKDLVWDELNYENFHNLGFFEDDYVLFDESIEENVKFWINYIIDNQIEIVHIKLSQLDRISIKELIDNKENEIFTPKKIRRDYL